jgi:diacylglycerol kinase family enzyme
MLYSFQTTKIRFTSNEEVAWTLDGEYGGKFRKTDIKNINKALTIMVDDKESNENIEG